MLNIKKYKDEIIHHGTQGVYRNNHAIDYDTDVEWCDVVDWLCSEYQEKLSLTDEEKDYLRDLKKWYNFDAIAVYYTYVALLQEKNAYTEEIVASITLPSIMQIGTCNRLDYGKVYSLEELEL